MTTSLYVNDVSRDDLQVLSIRAGYLAPWEAGSTTPAATTPPSAWGCSTMWSSRSTARCASAAASPACAPGGVACEGITFTAQDARWRLENEPVRINGRGSYVWNQRGSTCTTGKGGYDSPGRDGDKWTCGEIVADILEHALGVPAGGSGIPGHHGSVCCVPDPYLSTRRHRRLRRRLHPRAGQHLRRVQRGQHAGRPGHQPAAGPERRLLRLVHRPGHRRAGGGRPGLAGGRRPPGRRAGPTGRTRPARTTACWTTRLEWSLDGVATTITIQGAGQDASCSARRTWTAWATRPSATAASWRRWRRPGSAGRPAYRPLCQPARVATGAEQIDMDNEFTPPAGFMGYTSRSPASTSARPPAPSASTALQRLPARLEPGHRHHRLPGGPARRDGRRREALGLLLRQRRPSPSSAGPEGDAYDCYGYECARTVYDPSFRSVDGWPQPAEDHDDEAAMAVLAGRLLRQYRDVRRQGTLVLDRVDFATGLRQPLRRGEPERAGRRPALRQRAARLGGAAHQRRGGHLGLRPRRRRRCAWPTPSSCWRSTRR